MDDRGVVAAPQDRLERREDAVALRKLRKIEQSLRRISRAAFFTREDLRSWECGASSHCFSERQHARATAGELTWMIGE